MSCILILSIESLEKPKPVFTHICSFIIIINYIAYNYKGNLITGWNLNALFGVAKTSRISMLSLDRTAGLRASEDSFNDIYTYLQIGTHHIHSTLRIHRDGKSPLENQTN